MMTDLRSEVLAKCAHLDIPMVGFAPAERWDETSELEVPAEFRPRSIFPEARSVVVIGIPVHLPVLETTPSIWYHELYGTVNRLLDQDAYRIATMLNEQGHPSVSVPRDGYGGLSVLKERPMAFFSHRHAAYYAGLGTFGVNNMLLTPRYGPRVRFTSIFTSAELPADPVMKEEVCIRCMRCTRACPVGALSEGEYPEALTDKAACVSQHEELYKRHVSPCGICIKVCPVGRDRKHFARTDAALYSDREGHERYHRAWEHVRRYGGK